MNREDSIFRPKPEPQELIELVTRRFPLKMNEKKEERECLFILISKFLYYIFRLSKDLQGYEDFYVRTNMGSHFPWEDYRKTLFYFWTDKNLWANAAINCFLKQEHVCVVFYLAAWRYLSMPRPILQRKYDKSNESVNPHTDLFLFNKEKDQKGWAAYAVQLKILTRRDVKFTGELDPESYRAKGYLEKYIQDVEGVREDSKLIAKAFCYSFDNKDGKTENFVVNITPEEIAWDYCGNYVETLTSQFVNLTGISSQSQNKSNEKVWKYSQVQPDLTYQTRQSQSNFQVHSTQDLITFKPWRNHSSEYHNFPANYFFEASQMIPTQNQYWPPDMGRAFVGNNLKIEDGVRSSTSRHAFVNHIIIKNANQNCQNLHYKGFREIQDCEEIYPVQKRKKL